jgi:hypothetical protein
MTTGETHAELTLHTPMDPAPLIHALFGQGIERVTLRLTPRMIAKIHCLLIADIDASDASFVRTGKFLRVKDIAYCFTQRAVRASRHIADRSDCEGDGPYMYTYDPVWWWVPDWVIFREFYRESISKAFQASRAIRKFVLERLCQLSREEPSLKVNANKGNCDREAAVVGDRVDQSLPRWLLEQPVSAHEIRTYVYLQPNTVAPNAPVGIDDAEHGPDAAENELRPFRGCHARQCAQCCCSKRNEVLHHEPPFMRVR